MGADLYIKNLPRDPQYTGFRTDVDAGYFRDSYNDSSVLWKYGLSYWTDFKKWTNAEYEMSPEGAKKLLNSLNRRTKVFEEAIAQESVEDQQWFHLHSEELKSFLKRAIELNSNIICSV